MKTSSPLVKLSSIYYINNSPLLTLQSIKKEFNLYYNCEVKYFNSNFFFLQIDWDNFSFENTSVSDFKNNIAFNANSLKQNFLIPTAMLINGKLISYSCFTRLLGNAAIGDNFDINNEIIS